MSNSIKILFNEVQQAVTNFDGAAPDVAPVSPAHGSILYPGCTNCGLFTFQLGAAYGPDPLDWIRVERILLALDEADISAVRLVVLPPEGASFEAPFIRSLAEWNNAGMERLLFLNGAGLRLRPGSSLKLTTSGANSVQMAEVWWERERQIRPDPVTGADVFAYGV